MLTPGYADSSKSPLLAIGSWQQAVGCCAASCRLQPAKDFHQAMPRKEVSG
jgi:hypothetical protein